MAEDNDGQILLKKSDVLRGSFVEERHLQAFKGPNKSSGHFVVAPAYGLIWGIENPFPTDAIITPAGMTQRVAGVPVMQVPATKIPFMLHLYDMLGSALAGNWAPLEADFIVTRTANANGTWQVKLVPRRADTPGLSFASITVTGDQYVEHVEMMRPDGDADVLSFSKQSIANGKPSQAEMMAFNYLAP